MSTTATRTTARSINTSQRRALRRIVRFYRERVAYNGVTSVRYELTPSTHGVVWVLLTTRRSDCTRSSMRQLLCEERAHICIGPRGKLTVYDARVGIGEGADHTAHIAHMLDAHAYRR